MRRETKAKGRRQKEEGRRQATQRVPGVTRRPTANLKFEFWNLQIQNPIPARRDKIQNRTGTTYLAVCGMVLLVATISLGGLAAVRVRTRDARSRNDLLEARQYAVSATEIARLLIAQDKNWRTDYSNGAWFTNKPIGRGTYSLTVTNPNGALNHSIFDPVILSATGTCGKATQYVQVTLNAQTIPYTCMTAALSTASGISLGTAVVDANNQTLGTNGGVSASGTVNSNVSAVGAISGGAYNGTNTTITTPLTFPDATAFSYYQQNGTNMSIGSIPSATIQNVLLSATNNPFGGGTNANGVYVIDCQGNSLNIQNCRIVGTLVLLNPGTITIKSSVVWGPAVSNYPCLMVNGGLTITCNGSYLNEGGSQNFNPPGTPYPYPSGTSNSTSGDAYPAAIQGLIYVAGSLSVQGTELATNVIVVGGAFSTSNSPSLYLSYDPTYYKNPPPGFGIIQMIPSPGSWQQVVH